MSTNFETRKISQEIYNNVKITSKDKSPLETNVNDIINFIMKIQKETDQKLNDLIKSCVGLNE